MSGHSHFPSVHHISTSWCRPAPARPIPLVPSGSVLVFTPLTYGWVMIPQRTHSDQRLYTWSPKRLLIASAAALRAAGSGFVLIVSRAASISASLNRPKLIASEPIGAE